jgi:hypothetical protein
MKEENGGAAKRYTNHGRDEWHFWETGVVTGDKSATGEPEFLSEDWFFCERARELGVPVLVDRRIVLAHEGDKIFRFGSGQLSLTEGAPAPSSWVDIPGWFDFEPLYRDYVSLIPEGGRFVEVGVFLGKSFCAFGQFAREARKTLELHAVDTFQGTPGDQAQAPIVQLYEGDLEESFKRNCEGCGLNGEIRIHKGDSAAAARTFKPESCDIIFIDGDHSENAVFSDIVAWWPKLKVGGRMAGHDYALESVKKAVWEYFGRETATQRGSCWEVIKNV